MLLPRTRAEAVAVAEGVRAALAAHTYACEQTAIPVTGSIGVYRAKGDGRNRVRIAP